MNRLAKAAVLAVLIAPALALASQGSGTGQESIGSGTYLDSQGSGTGQESVGGSAYLSSQGSGTGQDATGTGRYLQSQGSGTGSAGDSLYAARMYTRQVIRRTANKLDCLTSFRCLFDIER